MALLAGLGPARTTGSPLVVWHDGIINDSVN